MVLVFLLRSWKLFYFSLFQFFCLNDLFTNKARKLEVAESNPIMDNIPSSLSLSVG